MTPAECTNVDSREKGGLVQCYGWIEAVRMLDWVEAVFPQTLEEGKEMSYKTIKEGVEVIHSRVTITGLKEGCQFDQEEMKPGEVWEFGNLRVKAT